MRRTPNDGNGIGLFAKAELLKLQKSGQFPDEPAKIKGVQAHSDRVEAARGTRNSRHKGNIVGGTIIIISTV